MKVSKQSVINYALKPGLKMFFRDNGRIRSLTVVKLNRDRVHVTVDIDGGQVGLIWSEVVNMCFAYVVTPDTFFNKGGFGNTPTNFKPFLRRYE